jgi:hypothetical protein
MCDLIVSRDVYRVPCVVHRVAWIVCRVSCAVGCVLLQTKAELFVLFLTNSEQISLNFATFTPKRIGTKLQQV